jgi:hypothetical protein
MQTETEKANGTAFIYLLDQRSSRSPLPRRKCMRHNRAFFPCRQYPPALLGASDRGTVRTPPDEGPNLEWSDEDSNKTSNKQGESEHSITESFINMVRHFHILKSNF